LKIPNLKFLVSKPIKVLRLLCEHINVPSKVQVTKLLGISTTTIKFELSLKT